MGPAAPLGKGHFGIPAKSDTLCHPELGHQLLALLVERGLALMLWPLGACYECYAVLQPFGYSPVCQSQSDRAGAPGLWTGRGLWLVRNRAA